MAPRLGGEAREGRQVSWTLQVANGGEVLVGGGTLTWEFIYYTAALEGDPGQVSDRGIEGAPLLAVEVLSPSTRRQDRTVKARRYAALGIPHYWIVDPERKRLECHRREGSAFHRVVQAEGDTVLTHTDWDGLAIDLAALWL